MPFNKYLIYIYNCQEVFSFVEERSVRLMVSLDAFLPFFYSGAEHPPAPEQDHLDPVGPVAAAGAGPGGRGEGEQESWGDLTTKDTEVLVPGVENPPGPACPGSSSRCTLERILSITRDIVQGTWPCLPKRCR